MRRTTFPYLLSSTFLQISRLSLTDSIVRALVSVTIFCCASSGDLVSLDLKKNQMVFLALHIAGGHIGLVIVLCFAIFSHKVHRDSTFLNFCITWIFSSVVYSILYVYGYFIQCGDIKYLIRLYRGTEGNTIVTSVEHVSPGTCLAQAALVNGAQVMTACSTMALVVQVIQHCLSSTQDD